MVFGHSGGSCLTAGSDAEAQKDIMSNSLHVV